MKTKHAATYLTPAHRRAFVSRLATLNRRRLVSAAWAVACICLVLIAQFIADPRLRSQGRLFRAYLALWASMLCVSLAYVGVKALLRRARRRRPVAGLQAAYALLLLAWTSAVSVADSLQDGDRSVLGFGILAFALIYRGWGPAAFVACIASAAIHFAGSWAVTGAPPPPAALSTPAAFAVFGGLLSTILDEAERRTYVLRRQLRERNLELRDLSFRDTLTGLYNRRYLDESLAQFLRVCARGGSRLSVALLDLDHFKRVNDELGHQAGDRTLARVATIVQASVRSSDLVSRYGGEEFVLVFPDTGLEGALLTAERVRAAVRSGPWPEVGWGVTASLGVAELAAGEGAAALVGRADERMLAAKRAGRDRVES